MSTKTDRIANPERYRTYDRRANRKRKRKVIDKYGGYCVGCGTSELVVLTLDHKNDDGFVERKETRAAGRSLNPYPALLKQPRREDLQVLCMNCQWRKRAYGPAWLRLRCE